MKRVYAKEEVCAGCGLCEVHCIVAHSKYRDNPIKAYKKQVPRPVARVFLEERRPVSLAVQCRHCDDPRCVKACITGAMHKDPHSGLVQCDSDRCVGCWTCVAACYHGAVRRDEEDGKVAAKCDMCADLGEELPRCVANCPNQALVFEEEEEYLSKRNPVSG